MAGTALLVLCKLFCYCLPILLLTVFLCALHCHWNSNILQIFGLSYWNTAYFHNFACGSFFFKYTSFFIVPIPMWCYTAGWNYKFRLLKQGAVCVKNDGFTSKDVNYEVSVK